MDQIFDRLGNLLKSLLREDETEPQPAGASGDPDMQTAWDELDDFLNSPDEGASARREEPRTAGSQSRIPEELRQDYTNLEVPFGAPLETVEKSYRHMVRKFHPDRHAGDAEKTKTATEITTKINLSLQRIRRHHKTETP